MRVLLVEDELHVRNALARSLVAWGHDVTEADSAELALAAIVALDFDLIVLDINLPDATGWDVLRKQIGPLPPVIVISAIPPSVTRLREFRPFGVLHKPFPIDSLRRLVDEAWSGHLAVPGNQGEAHA